MSHCSPPWAAEYILSQPIAPYPFTLTIPLYIIDPHWTHNVRFQRRLDQIPGMLGFQCFHFHLHGDHPSIWVNCHRVFVGFRNIVGGFGFIDIGIIGIIRGNFIENSVCLGSLSIGCPVYSLSSSNNLSLFIFHGLESSLRWLRHSGRSSLLGLQTIQQYRRQSLVKASQVLVQMSLQECQLFRLVLS